VLALAALSGAVADAQVSGSVAVVSDYRFRGVTLSDESPAVQAALLYDHASGVYVGGFASTVRLVPDGDRGFQGLGQVGYALRGPGQVSWDIGALYTDFSRPRGLGYADLYVGAAGTEWTVRLSYAPRYFGQPYSATYVELNVTPATAGAWSPLLHVGWLDQHPAPDDGPRSRWDGRIGIAYNFDRMTLQLSWATVSELPARAYEQHRSRWVLKAIAWLP
jgi:uncharacterized protein (TIGR02001 family)